MRNSTISRLFSVLLVLAMFAAACSDDDVSDSTASDDTTAEFSGTLTIGAIPDQDGEILARNYGQLATYLTAELGIEVDFRPVTEYDAAVTAFKVGDLDLVWFGGLTGVQARLQVEGAEAIAQRNIDEEFTSVFIATADSGIDPIGDVDGLSVLADHRFTFGSESSTSGRLMPQFFLSEAGLTLDSFDGEAGFSGSHDQTIALVEAGTFEVGVLNSQVWAARLEEGAFDESKVQLIFETPPFYDYHWVARPEIDEQLRQAIVDAFLALDPAVPEQAEILSFFGAESFIETVSANYDQIEQVGREIGKITE